MALLRSLNSRYLFVRVLKLSTHDSLLKMGWVLMQNILRNQVCAQE